MKMHRHQKWGWGLFLGLMGMLLLSCSLFPFNLLGNTTERPTTEATVAATEALEASPTAAPTSVTSEAVEAVPASTGGAVKITGSFTYTNDIITTYYVEHAVALVDMYGFVKRDREWEIPVSSQVLGYLKLDPDAKKGTYEIELPARPEGQFVDVDNDGQKDQGVQVFVVSYWPNLTGGPYSVGDDRSYGWPAYLTSAVTDSENHDEVVGGKLVVWAPDDKQEFPSDFGPDGLLFTADDPVAPIPAGYTIVDLDSHPFKFIRDPQPQLTLYEPKDVAIKDFSKETYVDAFNKMFAIVRKEYAFNGIPGKQPDWDALYDEIAPRVAAAQRDNDPNAFWLALRDFTWAFKDGHVGVSLTDYGYQLFREETGGGYGFALRELDDGRFMVVYVGEDTPAAKAGMERGAVVTTFNGEPVSEAIKKVKPWSMPFSTEWALRYQQVRYLTRAPLGTKATVTFINPGETTPKTVTLTAVKEYESFQYTSWYHNAPKETYLPVDYKVLDSGVGYIRINSNYDDLNLIIRLFQRALDQFEEKQVPGLIIDMRYNSGGAPLGLAGFFTDQEIVMGQLEYYSDKTGKFEPEGEPEKILPNEEQYHFDKIAVLVGPACYSACELEAYGFSKVPGAIVVGEYPTAGTEAEVSRGQFKMPEDISLQVPTGRFVNPDGSLFLEGQGVQPTLRVPITPETVLSDEDVVLKTAENAVLKPEGAGLVPSGPPIVEDPVQARAALMGGAEFLEDKARVKPDTSELDKPGIVKYVVPLDDPKAPVVWAYGWCAKDKATLNANFQNIRVTFMLDGQVVPEDKLDTIDYAPGGQTCRLVYAVLKDWPVGEHHLVVTATFLQPINDGFQDYPAGDYIQEYDVFVKP